MEGHGESLRSGQGLGLPTWADEYAAAVKKPVRCLLLFHEWRLMTNDQGQQYKTCTRCGAYRDFTPAAGAS